MNIYLRAFEPEDYLITTQWRKDKEITHLLGGNAHFASYEREKKWIESVIVNDSTNIRLAVVLQETDKLIGMVNLINVDHLNKNAEISILIGDKNYWGNGYGYEASIEMLNFGFNQRNLERIYLTVDVNHDKAISLYEKIGFKREGLLRRHHFKDGIYKDVFLYALLKNEYDSKF